MTSKWNQARSRQGNKKPARQGNKKPEKLVEEEIIAWCENYGWWVHVIDSKATYSPAAGVYKKSKAAPKGFSDLVGITEAKEPCFIELKAKGKRSTASDDQLMFLIEAILKGGFACVTDRAEHLGEVYRRWIFREADPMVLLLDLPCRKRVYELLRNFPAQSNLIDLLHKFADESKSLENLS